jgi:hypothetical protein
LVQSFLERELSASKSLARWTGHLATRNDDDLHVLVKEACSDSLLPIEQLHLATFPRHGDVIAAVLPKVACHLKVNHST